MVANPIPEVRGYKYAFDYPRTDTPPGTLLARWKSNHIHIVCRREQYDPDRSITATHINPPIAIDNERKMRLEASITGDVAEKLNAILGSGYVKSIRSEMTLTPHALSDMMGAVKAVDDSEECRGRARAFKELKRGARYLELVTEVAQFDFNFEITTTGTVSLSANLSLVKSIAAKLQAEAKASNSNKLTVTGYSTYTHYNLFKTPYRWSKR